MKARLTTKVSANALALTELLQHSEACTTFENTGPINDLIFVDYEQSITPSLTYLPLILCTTLT